MTEWNRDVLLHESVDALTEAKFRERVQAACQQAPSEKLLEASELFVRSCELMRAGILYDQPGLDEDGIRAEMHRRFAIARRLEEAGGYQPVPDAEVPEEWRA